MWRTKFFRKIEKVLDYISENGMFIQNSEDFFAVG
jgi:hypothetical protein